MKNVQHELVEWSLHNFGDRPAWQPLLGLVEEVGELSHAYLKRAQGIRTNEDHNAQIRDAVGDILIYLLDFCNAEGVDAQQILDDTWEHVKKRDWKQDPAGETL